MSGKKINPSENDAIIRVLANINFVGIGVWILTRHNPTLRLGIALIFLAQYVGGSTEGTWMRTIWLMNTPWNLSALMLLKYMLIFIPGTLVGDILANDTKTEITETNTNAASALLSFSLALGLTLTTLIGLLSRQVEVSFVILLVTLTAIGCWIFLQKRPATERALWTIGAVLLVAGYCAEPFQSGIKKDHATLSYFFITSGLATFWIWAFEILTAQTRSFLVEKIVAPIRLLGQNALMAYAMAGFLIVPLMGLTHLSDVFISKEQVALFGTLKAVFITVSMVILTAFFSKKKIFWKI